jgi:hypothetical protein
MTAPKTSSLRMRIPPDASIVAQAGSDDEGQAAPDQMTGSREGGSGREALPGPRLGHLARKGFGLTGLDVDQECSDCRTGLSITFVPSGENSCHASPSVNPGQRAWLGAPVGRHDVQLETAIPYPRKATT